MHEVDAPPQSRAKEMAAMHPPGKRGVQTDPLAPEAGRKPSLGIVLVIIVVLVSIGWLIRSGALRGDPVDRDQFLPSQEGPR